MTMTATLEGYGRAARSKAEAMGHKVKERMLEKRLERAHQEAERLRSENELLRDEVEGSRNEHRKILDMLEDRLSESGQERSHKGRWMLFLLALGGGAYALIRRRSGEEEWGERDLSSGLRAGAA